VKNTEEWRAAGGRIAKGGLTLPCHYCGVDMFAPGANVKQYFHFKLTAFIPFLRLIGKEATAILRRDGM
jgi:hypothetical protein